MVKEKSWMGTGPKPPSRSPTKSMTKDLNPHSVLPPIKWVQETFTLRQLMWNIHSSRNVTRITYMIYLVLYMNLSKLQCIDFTLSRSLTPLNHCESQVSIVGIYKQWPSGFENTCHILVLVHRRRNQLPLQKFVWGNNILPPPQNPLEKLNVKMPRISLFSPSKFKIFSWGTP